MKPFRLTPAEIAAHDFTTLPQVQEFPAMQLYAAEWLAGEAVQQMLPIQLGGFISLIVQSWLQHPPCSLPNDENRLAAISRLGAKDWKRYGALLLEQFTLCADGRLRNCKQTNVWLGMVALRKSRSGASKGDGLSEQSDSVCSDNIPPDVAIHAGAASASDSSSDSNAREKSQSQNLFAPLPQRVSVEDAAFADLWFEYPRKRGKAAAEKAFRRQIKTPGDLEAIRSALKNYREEIRILGTDETHTLHGSTWFSDRWRDYEDGTWSPPMPPTNRGNGRQLTTADFADYK